MTSRISILILIMFITLFSTADAPMDKVAVLDVGQGDAILLQSGAQQALIDGGQGRVVLERLAEELPWFDRTIEVIMVTHPQRDHVEGLLHVLERYDVSLVLLPEAVHSSQLQEAWLDMLLEKKIPYRFARAGQRLALGELQLSILSPLQSEAALAATAADINNASIVARADWDDVSFLLMGDAEARVERLLVDSWSPSVLAADVLKVGHHGSKSSTTAELLAAVQPRLAVVSAGAENRFGHPHAEVLNRLANTSLWRTDSGGTVRFVKQQERWLVSQ